MRRVVLAVMALAVSCVACGPQSGTPCGNSACNENEICDQALKLCIANFGPKVVIDAPVADVLIGSATFELRGTATDEEGAPKSVEYAIDDGEWSPLTVDDRGVFSVAAPTPAKDGEASTVKVRASDASNVSTEVSVQVRFDRAAPRCEILSPVEGAAIPNRNGLSATVEASVVDGTGVTAELSRDDGATWTALPLVGASGTYAWTVDAGIDRGEVALRVRARDEAGNVCDVGRATFVDTVPPTMAIQYPIEGWQCGNDRYCDVHATIGDSSGVLPQMLYSLDGGTLTPFPNPNVNPFVGELDRPVVDYTPVVLRIVARDSAGNESSELRNLAYDFVPALVTLVSPPEGKLLNAADVADAGGTVDVVWAIQDRNPNLIIKVNRIFADGGETGMQPGTPVVSYPISPSDNGTEYTTQLLVNDPGGSFVTVTHHFRADVVLPSFVVSPSLGARHTGTTLTMNVSEQATFTNSVTALSWDAGGAPGTFGYLFDGGYAWTGLSPGMVYRGTLAPAGVDLAGNPFVQVQQLGFFTAPVVPDAGTILATDAGTIAAAFDQDGVVTFADARSDGAGNVRFRWFDVDPSTGAVTEKQTQNATFTTSFRTDVSAWAAISSDATTLRKTSLIQRTDGASTGFLRTSAGLFTQATNPVAFILPGAVSPDTPRTGPVDYGLINQNGTAQLYSRPPNADLTLPIPGAIAVGGELSFVSYRTRLVGTVPNVSEVFERSTYVCDPSGISCDFVTGATGSATGYSSPSAALTPLGRALFVATSGGGQRYESCTIEFRFDPVPCGIADCSAFSRSASGSEDLTVSSAYDNYQVFGVRTVNGNYEVLERSLAPCNSAWTTLFTLPTTAGSKPIPVRFGKTRAALYVDPQGNVRVLR